ncbi:DNA-binding protein Alba [Candidatus Micrarchaeota archaeon]|nr:DNA-binding protein Alba [Candidatus Micrarchaeota archaeon]MBI5177277.1 DNA-binding protein Alba [Candidatus Micrarchaeota archaeon]
MEQQGTQNPITQAAQTQAAAPTEASPAIASHAGEGTQAAPSGGHAWALTPSSPAAATGRLAAPTRGENTIYIGKKNAMSYVLAVITQFNAGAREVRVKARGRAISRAVDVTQIVKNRFMPSAQIAGVDLSTEEVQSEDGSVSKVSSMEVRLTR